MRHRENRILGEGRQKHRERVCERERGREKGREREREKAHVFLFRRFNKHRSTGIASGSETPFADRPYARLINGFLNPSLATPTPPPHPTTPSPPSPPSSPSVRPLLPLTTTPHRMEGIGRMWAMVFYISRACQGRHAGS